MSEIKESLRIAFYSGPKVLKHTFSADDLNRISQPVIKKATAPIFDALNKADLDPEDIDLVLLAGGSSQIPGVYDEISSIFKKEPKILPNNLMLAIANGAALYQEETLSLPKSKRDIRTMGNTLGLLVEENGKRIPEILVNYNQELPTSVTKTLNLAENQKEVEIHLVVMDSNRNEVKKDLKVKRLRLQQQTSTLMLTMSVDENRLIRFKAFDPKHPNVRIDGAVGLNQLTDENLKENRKKLNMEIVETDTQSSQQPSIGIDLGTTTSELAFIPIDRDETGNRKISLKSLNNPDVPQGYAPYSYPSIVYIGKEGKPEVANTAAVDAQYDLNEQQRVAVNFKIADRSRAVIKANEHSYTVKELSAILLNKIWNDAKTNMKGMDLRKAVITVPAGFDTDAIEDTYEAARMAGIEEVVLIDEPTAAFTYYAHQFNLDKDKYRYVLIFDFGGGTTDVSILDLNLYGRNESQYKDTRYKILSVSGDDQCGGKHIDDALIDEVENCFRENNHLEPNLAKRSILRREVERVKSSLSDRYNEEMDL